MRLECIDVRFQDQPSVIACYAILGRRGAYLIDPGPDSARPHLVSSLMELGYAAQDIRAVLLTHIHLDHAGSAWWWAQQGADVYVHEIACKHLIDPTRLRASASQALGAQHFNDFGTINPISPDRLIPAHDGDCFPFEDFHVSVLATPGHTPHHVCFLLDSDLFAGDALGVRIPPSQGVSLPAVPPRFDPIAWRQTIVRIAGLHLSRIHLTHFGAVTAMTSHIDALTRILDGSIEFLRERSSAVPDYTILSSLYEAFVTKELEGHGATNDTLLKHQLINHTAMSTIGILEYLKASSSNP